MDAGRRAYDVAFLVDPELKRRRRYVQSLDTFTEKLKNDTLTFDDVLERILKCESSYQGMPIIQATVNKLKSIVREAFHDPEDAVQLALKVLHALLVSYKYEGLRQYYSPDFKSVRAGIHDYGRSIVMRFEFVPHFDVNVRFDKEGWPAPISTRFFDDEYPLITVVEAF